MVEIRLNKVPKTFNGTLNRRRLMILERLKAEELIYFRSASCRSSGRDGVKSERSSRLLFKVCSFSWTCERPILKLIISPADRPASRDLSHCGIYPARTLTQKTNRNEPIWPL